MPRTPAVLDPTDDGVPRPAGRPTREPQALTPAVRVRRAVTLLVLTVVAPGAAQFAAGHRRLGRIALRVWAGLVGLAALAGLLLLLNRSLLLSVATSPSVLGLVAVVLFAGAVAWPLLVVDAWRLGRPHQLPRRPRLAIGAAMLVLVLVTSLPLIGAGRRVLAGADFIDGVFGDGHASAAHEGRYNVLLLGGDAGPDRMGTRPDSMTLVSIDADTGRAVLLSLPRNLENVPFAPGSAAARAKPGGWSCGDKCLLNGIYTWGSENRSLFPGEADPGAAAMKQAVAGVTGLEVNYYVLIDLRGFSNLIEAMDGIDVTVGQRVPIGGGTSKVSGYIEPGRRHLDGYHALWYARSRHGASDYERMARQRCVMDAMLRQLDPGTVLTKFQALAAAGKNVVSTDLPAGEIGTFLDLAAKAKGQKISSVQFVPPLINPARPDLALIRDKVAQAIRASEQAPADTVAVAPRTPAGTSGGAPSGRSGGSSRSAGPGGGGPAVPSSSATPGAEASDVSAVCSPA